MWFELAAGEKPEDLRYLDEVLIDAITPDVMKCLADARFFELLDDVMRPEDRDRQRSQCWGDVRNSRSILLNRGFREAELFDVFHVLMRQGGFYDCESCTMSWRRTGSRPSIGLRGRKAASRLIPTRGRNQRVYARRRSRRSMMVGSHAPPA